MIRISLDALRDLLTFDKSFLRKSFDIMKYMKRAGLFVLYTVVVISAFPIARYFYIYLFLPTYQETKFLIVFRVFFSAPLLLISGISLLMFYGRQGRYIGYFALLVGFITLVILFKAISAETGVI